MSNVTPSEKLQLKIIEAAAVIKGIPDFSDIVKNSFSNGFPKTDLCKWYIQDRLSKLGIYSDDESYDLLMNDCQEGEARKVFCENGEPNLPSVRFKKVWKILTAQNGVVEPEVKEEGKEVNIAQEILEQCISVGRMSDKILLEKYSIDCPDEIIDELQKRSKNRAFVAFKDVEAGTIDVETSMRMLRESRRRDIPIHYKIGDSLKRLYVAGDFPSQYYIQCPLHKHVLLFDGYCDECKATWEGVDYNAMQFVRLAVSLCEAPTDKVSMRQLINTARQEGIEGLKADYPETAFVYSERQIDETLPGLKVRQSIISGEGAIQDPLCPVKSNKRTY